MIINLKMTKIRTTADYIKSMIDEISIAERNGFPMPKNTTTESCMNGRFTKHSFILNESPYYIITDGKGNLAMVSHNDVNF